MPSLDTDMAAGTLVEWLVKSGDSAKRGDVAAVVETQKGAIEIFNDGVMSELHAAVQRAAVSPGDLESSCLLVPVLSVSGWPVP